MDAREAINLYARLADMKAVDYRNTVALAALIDLLVEKGLLTRDELARAAARLNGPAAGE
jgi:hypothetical protein